MTDILAGFAGIPCWSWFLTAAIAAPVARGGARVLLLLGAPVLGLLSVLATPFGNYLPLELFGLELFAYRIDALSYPFLLVFNVAAFIGGLFAMRVEDKLQSTGALLYAGGTMAVVAAGDLLSLVVAWEIMGLSSAALIFANRSPEAITAGLRYLMFQLLSGFLLVCGVGSVVYLTGDARFDYIGINHISGLLIFAAFGIKCGFPLLHNWITDGYPQATISGVIFLSALTTKAAVYAMARSFPGTEELLYAGVVMACLPIFYALLENDLRRVLAYSIMVQVGFMLCGIGTGLELGINGAVAHAVNDIFFKALLFMVIGAVLYATGRCCCSDLGGLYRLMPKTTVLCIAGAAAISAVPLFSGFVSKSPIMDAVLQNGNEAVWYGLLFAAAASLLYVGIKMPYFAFFARPTYALYHGSDPPWPMLAGMTLAATLCILPGLLPQYLYSLLPYAMEYDPYDSGHVLAQIQLLMFSALAFIWLYRRGLYPRGQPSVILDSDWLYRRLAPRLAVAVVAGCGYLRQQLHQAGGVTSKLLHSIFAIWPERQANNDRAITMAVLLLLLLVLHLLL